MNRIRNVQILFLLGAAALLSACTSVTTTVPSGRAPAFEARADQVVVIDPADVAAELLHRLSRCSQKRRDEIG